MLFIGLSAFAQGPSTPKFALNFNSNSLDQQSGTHTYGVTMGAHNVADIGRYGEEGQGLRTSTQALIGTPQSQVNNAVIRVNNIASSINNSGTINFTAKMNDGITALTYKPFFVISNGGQSYFEGLFLGVTNQGVLRLGGGINSNFFGSVITEFNVDSNRWYNYTVSFKNVGSGSYVALYVDGELIAELENGFNLSFNNGVPLSIGGSAQTVYAASDINFDHFYIWDTALEASDVEYLFDTKCKVESEFLMNENYFTDVDNFNALNLHKETYDRLEMVSNVYYGGMESVADRDGVDHNAMKTFATAEASFISKPKFTIPEFAKIIREEGLNELSFSLWYNGEDFSEENSLTDYLYYPLAAIAFDTTTSFTDPGILLARKISDDKLMLLVKTLNDDYLEEAVEIDWNTWNHIECVAKSHESVELIVNGVTVVEIALEHGLPIRETSLLTFGYMGNENRSGFLGGVYDDFAMSAAKTANKEFLDDYVFISSVNDVNNSVSIGVYPNPSVNGIFNINADTPIIGVYDVMDITGKVVASGSLNSTRHQINLSDKTSGMYLLKINSNQGSHVIKLTK